MQRLLENEKFIIKYSKDGKNYEKSIVAASQKAAYSIAYACRGNFKIENVIPATK